MAMDQPKPRPVTSLHDIILDYVINNAYSGTARALANKGPPTPRGDTDHDDAQPSLAEQLAARSKARADAMDVDDDVEDDGAARDDGPEPPSLDEAGLEHLEERRGIIDAILSGAIVRAVDALHTHFPSVLNPASNGQASNGVSNGMSRAPSNSTSARASGDNHSTPVFARSTEPDHVRLNLQIQQFIESFRQITPSAPSSPTSSSIESLNGSGSGSAGVALSAALTALQGLHADALHMRPEHRSVYLQEIKDVGGLLAYKDPENSTLGGFLDQARRIALAQQVNAAILRSEGRAVQSYLEQIARRTSAIYETITEKEIDPHPAWTGTDAKGANAAHWRIAEQLKRRPFQKGGFNLHEYVWEMA